MGDSVKVKVVCVMGDITLHIGESQIGLSVEQAHELAGLLEEAACVADDDQCDASIEDTY